MTTQIDFDKTFITSTEVCQRLHINRSTVLLNVRGGRLPEPIRIRRPSGSVHIMLWNREAIEPALTAWGMDLDCADARKAG